MAVAFYSNTIALFTETFAKNNAVNVQSAMVLASPAGQPQAHTL